jgi:hypothetical protein
VFKPQGEQATVSKPDFIASMIHFVDDSLKSDQPEEEGAGRIKRWLSPGDQALKVRDDELGSPQDG